MKVKRLHDEVVTLKTAIEKAIREGQKSTDDLKDIPRSGRVSKRTLPSPAWTEVRGLSAGSTIFELTSQCSSTSQRTHAVFSLIGLPSRQGRLYCTSWIARNDDLCNRHALFIRGTPKWLLTPVQAAAIINYEDGLRGARSNANTEVDRERQDN